MSEISCERVCASVMAAADGYPPDDMSGELVDAHLRGCAECRREVEDLRALTRLLGRQKRRGHSGDVWPSVAARLAEAEAASRRRASAARAVFTLLGLVLLCFRVTEMLPERAPGLYVKALPVLLAAAAFAYLRENPFRVDTELKLEGA